MKSAAKILMFLISVSAAQAQAETRYLLCQDARTIEGVNVRELFPGASTLFTISGAEVGVKFVLNGIEAREIPARLSEAELAKTGKGFSLTFTLPDFPGRSVTLNNCEAGTDLSHLLSHY